MNKTKVLVFTNKIKWDGNITTKIRRDRSTVSPEWNNNYPSRANPVICKYEFYNNQAQLIPLSTNSISDVEGIFFVYDALPPQDFDTLKTQCTGDTLYILAHRNGNYPKSSFGDWKCKGIKEGSHTNYPEDYFITVFDILTDSDDDEMNRIINQVFRPLLDAALGLLDQCNADSNFDPTTSLLAKSFPKNSDAEKAITTYSESGRDLRDLEALRDELLKYALEQN